MNHLKKSSGIIFDMDNTLLNSNIDFINRKREICEYLHECNMMLFSKEQHKDKAVADFLEEARSSPGYNSNIEERVWEISRCYEEKGMTDAELIPGVRKLLMKLQDNYYMYVLTNSTEPSAYKTIKALQVEHFFEDIIGRERNQALKPSPDGVLYILNLHANVSLENWVLVGDTWMDGLAAQRSGIKFILFNGSYDTIKNREIDCLGQVHDMDQLFDLLQKKTDSTF